ncbi:hypothetical protein TI05_01525 [Achromatium sp. WMS3]|nr:hypothetical protein TI05_01525 [Achromatium sp. WMS3]
MRILHTQYIVDENQNKTSVVLPIEEWNAVISAMEELEDIQAYDNAKAINDEILPFEKAIDELGKVDD